MAPSNPQKHQAGRHLAVAEALLRGYAASLHRAQTFVKINGRTAAVQLAAQGVWMIADIEKMTAMSTDFHVLVDVTDGRRDFYVVPGDDLRAGVRERHEEFMASVGGVRPRNPDSRQTTIYPANVEAWRDRWSLFD
jgi:outer membrane usher protein FimD/PapC